MAFFFCSHAICTFYLKIHFDIFKNLKEYILCTSPCAKKLFQENQFFNVVYVKMIKFDINISFFFIGQDKYSICYENLHEHVECEMYMRIFLLIVVVLNYFLNKKRIYIWD
jgi:hypothetical protein